MLVLVAVIVVVMIPLAWWAGTTWLADSVSQFQRIRPPATPRQPVPFANPTPVSPYDVSPRLAIRQEADALTFIDPDALAGVLAVRLRRAMSDFLITAAPDASVWLRGPISGETVVPVPVGRWRLEPVARAVTMASQQVLADVQVFVEEVLGQPWPQRPMDDPLTGLLHAVNPEPLASESAGTVRLRWKDSLGTVLELDPFEVSDVLRPAPSEA